MIYISTRAILLLDGCPSTEQKFLRFSKTAKFVIIILTMSVSIKDLTITLVSGANGGIGLATATRLAKEHGHHVIVGSRNADAGAKVASELQAEGYAASSVQLDLDSDASIFAAAKSIELKFGRLDVLINNAGILIDHIPGQTSRDMFTKTFSTNVIGTACLTEAMLHLLRKSTLPRIVFVSSRMGSLKVSTDATTPWYPMDYKAYDSSKAAISMLAINYNRILSDVGGRVNLACPGLVATNLSSFVKAYGGPPYLGAQRIVELATMDKNGPTETFSDKDGEISW